MEHLLSFLSKILVILYSLGIFATAPENIVQNEYNSESFDTTSLADLKSGEVYSIKFTSMTGSRKLRSGDATATYDFKGNLTPDGTPSDEFSICTWFRMEKHSDDNYLVSIQPPSDHEDIRDKNNYYFFNIGIDSDGISIQTRFCNMKHEVYIQLVKWYHMCVSLSQTITIFFEDKEAARGIECLVNGTAIMTNTSLMTIGSHSFSGLPIDGSMADIKTYPIALTKDEAKSIKYFNSTLTDYVSVFDSERENDQNIMEKSIIEYEDLVSEKIESSWIYIPDKINQTEANVSCIIYGGSLLKTSDYLDDEILIDYLETVIKKPFIEIWIVDNGKIKMASISRVSIMIEEIESSKLHFFICSIPAETKYKLVGIPGEVLSMTLLPDELAFQMGTVFKLVYDNRMIYLDDGVTGERMIILYATLSPANIMGRKHVWKSVNTTTYRTLMTSSCAADQFTCDDGLCVDLDYACDFQKNCLDSSDERYCNTTELRPSYYDLALSGQDLLRVKVGINLDSIVDIDMDKNLMVIKLSIKTSWRDHRVSFHNLHMSDQKYILPNDAHFYWQPNIQFENVVHTDIFRFSLAGKLKVPVFLKPQKKGIPATFQSKEVILNEGSDVEMSAEVSDILTTICSMDLLIYPFDIQICEFSTSLVGWVKADAIWDPEHINLTNSEGIEDHLYDFLGFRGYLDTSTMLNNTNKIDMEIILARSFGSHVLVTFLPCILLQVIGLSVFAIPIDDLSDRLTVSISCLIVMAALFTQMSSTLPVSAAPKMIDFWMFTHVLMLAMVFVLQLVINSVQSNESDNEVQILSPGGENGFAQMVRKTDNETDKRSDWTIPKKGSKCSARKWNKVCWLLCVTGYSLFVIIYFLVIAILRTNKYTNKLWINDVKF